MCSGAAFGLLLIVICKSVQKKMVAGIHPPLVVDIIKAVDFFPLD